MAAKITASTEALAAMKALPPNKVLVIDGTVVEATLGYTLSCRGIDPDQMGVHICSELPEPHDDFLKPRKDIPLFVDKDIIDGLNKRGKNLHIISIQANDGLSRFLSIAK